MPDLDWDEQEFLECIAVLPEVEEYETEHIYRSTKAGISLTVTLWKYESTVEIALAVGKTARLLTRSTYGVHGRVHCLQEQGRTALVFPDAVLVPSRFYHAREWSFADTHPGVDVTVQIFPEITLTLTEAVHERRRPARAENRPTHATLLKNYAKSLPCRLIALLVFSFVLVLSESGFLILCSRLDKRSDLDGLILFGFVCIGAFLCWAFDTRIKY